LPAEEKRLLCEAAWFHWIARIALLVVPFRRITDYVDGLYDPAPASSKLPKPSDLARLVAASSVVTPRATCLTRSLSLQAMLRRRGYRAELRIGVAKPDDRPLEAHAWVVLDGEVYLGGPELSRFSPMPTPNSAS
jgi:hypothetical protein